MSLIEKQMSEKQIATSQANGGHSQGPVTPQGRARSRRSSLKHGLYAQSFEEAMLPLGEDPEEFEKLRQGLVGYWQPPDAFRQKLVERLARALWKLERADRAEAGATAVRIRALQAECSNKVRQIDAGRDQRLGHLEALLEAVRGGDQGDSALHFNALYHSHPTERSERIRRLMFAPDEATAGAESSTEALEATDEEAGAAAELERLLEDEIRESSEAYDRWRQREAEPSAAEWSSRLLPDSPYVTRWQDSQSRQIDRLTKLLFRMRDRDETGCPKPSGQPESPSPQADGVGPQAGETKGG